VSLRSTAFDIRLYLYLLIARAPLMCEEENDSILPKLFSLKCERYDIPRYDVASCRILQMKYDGSVCRRGRA
jgi:hypothetical protein